MRIEVLVKAHQVWLAKCVDGDLPIWGDLDFLDFDSNIIPYMVLVDIDGKPGYGRYRYWGSRVATSNGQNMTNLRVSDLSPSRHADYSGTQYRWVVDNAQPGLFISCLWEKTWDQKFEAVLRLPCRSSADSGIDRVVAIGVYGKAMRSISDYISTDIDLGDYFGVET